MRLDLSIVLYCFQIIVVSTRNIQKRIRGGELAQNEEFPYQASLTLNGIHECGGALISKFHVLSAAHCVDLLFPPTFSVAVLVGSIYLGQGKSYAVKRMSRHKEFKKSHEDLYPDDIGILQLAVAVKISLNVAPIGLPVAYSELPVQTPVTVTGFGSIVMIGPLSQSLRKLSIKTVSLEDCRPCVERPLRNTQICTRDGEQIGCCFGDSGSPLVLANKSTIVGILSSCSRIFNSGCPDIYTKVSHYIPYIQAEMNYTEAESSSENMAMNFFIPAAT